MNHKTTAAGVAGFALLGLLIGWWVSSPSPQLSETPSSPETTSPEVTTAARPSDLQVFFPSTERPPPSPLVEARPGEILLTAEDDAAYRLLLARARALGLDIKGTLDRLRTVRIGITDQDALQRLRRELAGRVGSEPNTLVTPPPLPEVPLDSGLAAGGETYFELLGIDSIDPSWGEGVTVAVIDSGVEAHRTFAEGVLLGPDGPALWEDGDKPNGHGTAVASLIAGSHPLAPGLAPATRLLSYSVLDASGVGDAFGLAEALISATDAGAQVINLSLGGHGDSSIVRQALAYAGARGALVVAAVGNDGTEGIVFPASLESVLAVGSVDANGHYASFSNRGDSLDIVAPGVGLNAAWPGDRLIRMSGTSASAPVVSAMAAVLLSQDARLTPAQAGALITQYANDAGAPGPDGAFGNGVANLGRALQRTTRGIYDLAVTHVAAAVEGDGVRVTVGVQNRGTERMYANQVKLVVNGRVYYHSFSSLDVGQTAWHPWLHHGLSSNVLRVAAEIEADGRDARPADNRVEWERSWPPSP